MICARVWRLAGFGLTAAVLQPLVAFDNRAEAAELTVDEAIAAAVRPSAHLPDDAVLRLAERWPSRAFEEIPWGLLPREAALRHHARARFFDVVLADLEEGALNEQIAVAFVRFERARDGASAHGAALLGLESRYRDLLEQRDAARARQRAARSLLALAMRNPGELVRDLVEPTVEVKTETEEPSVPAAGSATLRTEEAAARMHAYLVMRGRAVVAAGAELAAARKQLEYAEALQDERRAIPDERGEAGIRLGEAMAAVARAQVNVYRTKYRAVLYREVAEALAATLP